MLESNKKGKSFEKRVKFEHALKIDLEMTSINVTIMVVSYKTYAQEATWNVLRKKNIMYLEKLLTTFFLKYESSHLMRKKEIFLFLFIL